MAKRTPQSWRPSPAACGRGRTSLDWLTKHDIPWDAFHIRADDGRPDVVVKRDILLHQLRPHRDVVHAWDDNPNVIALWKEYGIPVTTVPGWGTPPLPPIA